MGLMNTPLLHMFLNMKNGGKPLKIEYDVVIKTKTSKIVDCHPNVKSIGFKLVYIIKYKFDGEMDKFKHQIVTKGST